MNNPPPSVNSLLTSIKSTVELLIQFRGDSLTTKYGAIERLRLAILAILSHGLKQNINKIYSSVNILYLYKFSFRAQLSCAHFIGAHYSSA
ncbi:unnamed protein product [Rotaria socialis]|uniref:Uncharacterized protein n=1 Tax=Rotaria socialis TaxID=392032 RepID=A0A821H7E6_9BILA|nr:unnamed protein product [Rotaria socialis]